MFRYGISTIAFAAASDAGGGKKPAVKKPAKAKAGETETIAEKTQDATTEDNPASTTSAASPEHDAAAAEAAANGTLQAGKAGPADDALDTDNPALGNRHSHPAETEAERTVRLAAGGTDADAAIAAAALGSQAMPAGEDADPANQPQPGEKTAEQLALEGSSQDESGDIQDATRLAIGAGNGAPDGITGPGADPSEAEVNQLKDDADGDGVADDVVELENGTVFRGGKAKLWRALEKGATHKDLLDATGYRSALGTMNIMLQFSGREVEVTEDKKTGERSYKLKPVEKKGKAE